LYPLFTQKDPGGVTVLPYLEPFLKYVVCFAFIDIVLVSGLPPQKHSNAFCILKVWCWLTFIIQA